MAGRDDPVVRVAPALARVGDFASFPDEAATYGPLRMAELVGRPVGAPDWIAAVDARTALTLAPGKRGPKPRGEAGV